jgi:hypothetical protein
VSASAGLTPAPDEDRASVKERGSLPQGYESRSVKGFDALVPSARERLYGTDPDDEKATEERSIRTRIRTREGKTVVEDVVDDFGEETERPCVQGLSHMARPGLEPGTPRFSVVWWCG